MYINFVVLNGANTCILVNYSLLRNTILSKTLALALDDGMISLWEEALDHKTSLSEQRFIEVPVQSQESERSYNMFVLGDIDFEC
jgi:hypothetical protein